MTRPPPINGSSPEAVELAKAVGLDPIDLQRFIIDVEAGQVITVTAFYNKFITYADATQLGIITKRFVLTPIS